jgi:FMN phosphatase YigB (HAD superfamily)
MIVHKPVLFLDFDRTLFDTDKFYEWLGDERFSRLLDLTAGKIASPDFSEMVYADTIPFLNRAKETHRLVLLTFAMNTALQRRKIRGSNLVSYFDDIIMTQGAKGEEVKNYLERMGDTGWEHAFIDDAPKTIFNA